MQKRAGSILDETSKFEQAGHKKDKLTQEASYLLKTEKNANRLRESIMQYKKGKITVHMLMDK